MSDIIDNNVPVFDVSAYLSQLTTLPGIYRMVDKEGVVLYVGKASNLKKRVSSYFSKQTTSRKTQSLVNQIAHVEVTITSSETEALLLESNLIKSLRPKYNVVLRDDKSYPYIHVHSSHNYPGMDVYRTKKKPKSGDYFGPYPSGYAIKETLNIIQKVFKIRNCRDSFFNGRSRPCLQYQIKRCTAPCVGYISPEEYQQAVNDAIRFLQGKCQQIIETLTARMDDAVHRLAYEEAAIVRDQIKNLRQVQEQQSMVQQQGDADVIAIETKPGFACILCVTIRDGQVIASQSFFPKVPVLRLENEEEAAVLFQEVLHAFIGFYYLETPTRIPADIILNQPVDDAKALAEMLTQIKGKRCRLTLNPRGTKARWVEFADKNLQLVIAQHQTSAMTMSKRYKALSELLRLSEIRRMECFDISHTQGEATVASCVVFNEQGPEKSLYRRFNITGITGGDDYAAMEQAVKRRFKRLQVAQDYPDVLIIDGGLNQVAVAVRVLAELGIENVPIVGVAKGPDRKAGWERLILVDQHQEITLPMDSPALHLLQHIRDEAHRFAITTHRKKRDKTRLESSLESLEGVGPKRRQALLKHFGGLRELSRASAEEIAKAPGINHQLAQRIYQHFR